MASETPGAVRPPSRRIPWLLLAAVVLAAFVGWRLYLAFLFVKLIFLIIFFPIRLIGEVLDRKGP